MTNPDSFSFNGATWYDNDKKYQRRAFKDYLEDGTLNQNITGGWLAMLQHHFFTARSRRRTRPHTTCSRRWPVVT